MEHWGFTSDYHWGHNNILKYSRRLQFMDNREQDEFHRLDELGDLRKRSLRISQASVNRMQDAIIQDVNDTMHYKGELWVLGDIYLGNDLNELRDLRKRIHCRTVNLVLGNHDKLIRKLHKPFMGLKLSSNKTNSDIYSLLMSDLNQEEKHKAYAKLVMKHAELQSSPLCNVFGQIHEQAYITFPFGIVMMSHFCRAVWPKSHRGAYSLYGHSHASLEAWREEHLPGAKTIDVGIDYRFRLGKRYTPWGADELTHRLDELPGLSIDHHE